jgi:hypothetical protein
MDLEKELEKVLDQMEQIKELNADLKDLRENHPNQTSIMEVKDELKRLKNEVEADPAIEELKDTISTARERLTLLKEILVAKMMESEVEEVVVKGKKAVKINQIKLSKAS